MPKVSLKSIAREFGVSAATVSLVLNNKDKNGRVSKELSQKIQSKAKELDYMPNTLAKGLRIGNSKTLGLIIADITNVFFGALAFRVQVVAERLGYTVIIGNTNEDLDKLINLVDLLRRRQVDGFIIVPTEGSMPVIEGLISNNMPVVLVDRGFPELPTSSVTINNYEISFAAVSELIKKGCQKIGIIIYTTDHQTHMHDRKQGYVDALTQGGIYDESLVKEVRYINLEEDCKNAVAELLNSKADGIFFTTNTISMMGLRNIMVIHHLNATNIQLMCFDENDAYCLLPFKIPFIKQPIEAMAKDATEMIIQKIEKKDTSISNKVINASLKLD